MSRRSVEKAGAGGESKIFTVVYPIRVGAGADAESLEPGDLVDSASLSQDDVQRLLEAGAIAQE